MPLGPFYVLSSGAGSGDGGVEGSVDLAGEVPLEDAADLFGRASFGASLLDVGAGFRIVCHSDDCGHVQGAVQASVSAAVEPVAGGVPG